jgi:aromatic-L-amino-acid/L-tryptophan decarboxylase
MRTNDDVDPNSAVIVLPQRLSVVCFQYRSLNTAVQIIDVFLIFVNGRLLVPLEKDGRVFLSGTKIHGKRMLRACSVNHRLGHEHVDFLLKVIPEVAGSLVSR